jgi:predicted kinase
MSERARIVVQMHGEPGSGKSTLARAIAPHIRAVVLDKDVIKASLLRSGIAEAQAASGAYEVYFAQARHLVEQGHSIILDNPVFWARVEERWLAVSDLAGCPPILIETMCADRDELVRRLATREALESQPRDPLDIKRYPNSSPTKYAPRITLDTATRARDDLVRDAIAFIESRLEAASPTTDDRRLATAP